MTPERMNEIKKMNIGAPVDELLHEIARLTAMLCVCSETSSRNCPVHQGDVK